jgi:hypothetical protein
MWFRIAMLTSYGTIRSYRAWHQQNERLDVSEIGRFL